MINYSLREAFIIDIIEAYRDTHRGNSETLKKHISIRGYIRKCELINFWQIEARES